MELKPEVLRKEMQGWRRWRNWPRRHPVRATCLAVGGGALAASAAMAPGWTLAIALGACLVVILGVLLGEML